MLLMGWNKFLYQQNQSLPALQRSWVVTRISSVGNFCSHSLGVIWWGNQWWHHKMSAIFSSYWARGQEKIINSWRSLFSEGFLLYTDGLLYTVCLYNCMCTCASLLWQWNAKSTNCILWEEEISSCTIDCRLSQSVISLSNVCRKFLDVNSSNTTASGKIRRYISLNIFLFTTKKIMEYFLMLAIHYWTTVFTTEWKFSKGPMIW